MSSSKKIFLRLLKGIMRLFIPKYGNYYHFMTESAMGLYRELRDQHLLDKRECELWYCGKYESIVQLFSCHAIYHPKHLAENDIALPLGVRTLTHIRPKTLEQWAELLPLSQYLSDMFPTQGQEAGITVIRRVGKREYAEHSELLTKLSKFDIPVREAIMESLAFGEQIELMRATSILIAPHGAGQTNMMFMKPRSKIIELYPKGFSDRCFPGMSTVFQHYHVEIESTLPSVVGRQPSERVRQYLGCNPWPTRKDFLAWKPDQMELGRVLRDVKCFSIDPERILRCVEEMANLG
jgi:hypothetical protein